MSLSSRNWFRGLAATSAAVVFAVAGGAAALADEISNNLDTSIDAVAENMNLSVGGSAGTDHPVRQSVWDRPDAH